MKKYEVEFIEHGASDSFKVIMSGKDFDEVNAKAKEIEERLHWHEYFNEVSEEWDETSWSKYIKEIKDTDPKPYLPEYQVKS